MANTPQSSSVVHTIATIIVGSAPVVILHICLALALKQYGMPQWLAIYGPLPIVWWAFYRVQTMLPVTWRTSTKSLLSPATQYALHRYVAKHPGRISLITFLLAGILIYASYLALTPATNFSSPLVPR